MVADFNPTLLPTPLLAQQFLCQGLLHMRRHQNAALAVFSFRSSMNTNPFSTRNLLQYRQRTLEFRTPIHSHTVRQCRYQVIRILNRIAHRYQYLLKSCLSRRVQSPSHSLSIRRHSMPVLSSSISPASHAGSTCISVMEKCLDLAFRTGRAAGSVAFVRCARCQTRVRFV